MIDHIDDFIADQDWSLNTVSWVRRRLTIWFEYAEDKGLRLEGLSKGQFTRWLNQARREGLSYSSRNGMYNAVGQFSSWLQDNGHIEGNCFTSTDKPKRPRKEKSVIGTVAKDYLIKMVTYAENDANPMNRRNAAILRVLTTTGMRRGECANLATPDLDFAQSRITIRETKTGIDRVAILQPETAYALRVWLQLKPKTKHDKVFVSLTPNKAGIYKPLRPDAINKIVDKMKCDAGIGAEVKITPHMLRHTFASTVVKGGNTFALMSLMGHSDVKTTEIYVHNDERELRRMANYAPKIPINEGD